MTAPGPGQNTSLGVSLSEHFLLPRTASKIFQGRSKDLAVLQRAYDDAAGSTHEKRFVVFGVGGAGKTEFCCKFAIENRDRWVLREDVCGRGLTGAGSGVSSTSMLRLMPVRRQDSLRSARLPMSITTSEPSSIGCPVSNYHGCY